MDKRYQVFVSSTYADLKDERQKVIQTLMEMDCIPSGMELFPASDEEQFDFIKKIIDDCDYYLLIIGGRYGSVTSEGVSYTEKEYDYAVSKNIQVIAFLHGEPNEIPVYKKDNNEILEKRLADFRKKVQTGRLIKHWENSHDLPGLVSLSLNKAIRTYPAQGWMRASNFKYEELLSDINQLRKENAELHAKLNEFQFSMFDDLADLDEMIVLQGTLSDSILSIKPWNHEISWGKLFSLIGPDLMRGKADHDVEILLCNEVVKIFRPFSISTTIDRQIYNTVKIQFQAYGLVKIEGVKLSNGDFTDYWNLTEKGKMEIIRLRTIRTKR
ncbi:hypothetical protein Jab_1c00550 [Janthinobacterium sp. HH01]|uniref:DUF4062 domain-containing protein n=1 Tax=Janthinobacterium sp. HH01 TaxID=1198452 RepID=UPI0002AE8CA0|nr:DUF4062 domain-containing protein [Janthinobacterium sp. HH01]ELX11472.1 hypothetical protein Jab_1c00550 [Janthinobacterium sp. HH01]